MKQSYFPRFSKKDLIREMYRVGIEPLLIILIVNFALSAALIYQAQISLNLIKYGLAPMLGAATIGINREIVPLIVGLIIAASIGTAFAAEIASMKITEQTDALKSFGIEPFEYLFFPKFLACLLMTPPLTIFAWLASFAGGFLAAKIVNVHSVEFMKTARDYFNYSFLVSGLIRSMAFGALISIISCLSGFTLSEKEKDTLSIGKATRKAVVISFIAIFISNLLFVWLFKC